MTWVDEVVKENYRHSFKVDRSIHRGTTDFQVIEIFENRLFGRMLVLDGVVQTTERDERYYHEMLVHPSLFALGDAKRALIVGGGDGGALREALRHSLERAVLVELDEAVIALCRQHMPALSAGAFDDPRSEIVNADGARYMARTSDSFDAIFVDSTDPVGPGAVLFEPPFYRDCQRRLNGAGVLACQCGTIFESKDVLARVHGHLSALFTFAGAYIVAVPSYSGGYLALAWASDALDLAAVPEALLAERVAAADLPLHVYSAAFHLGAMRLPAEIAGILGR